MKYSKRLALVGLAGLLGAAMPLVSARAATYTAQERANMKVVADFYAALDRGDAQHDLKQKIRGIADRYLKADYIQHNATMRAYGPGREGFIRLFESMPSAPPGGPVAGTPPPRKVLALMANGDLVIRVSTLSSPLAGGEVAMDGYIFNMFRVQGGKLAEHWDAAMLPNGKRGGPAGPGKASPGPQGHPMPQK